MLRFSIPESARSTKQHHACNALEQILQYLFAHPNCPIKPLHFAGHHWFSPLDRDKALFAGTIGQSSLHHTLAATHLWAQAQRDCAGFVDALLAPFAPPP